VSAIAAVRGRFDELNAITRTHGRAYSPAQPLDDVLKALPPEWYSTWHREH